MQCFGYEAAITFLWFIVAHIVVWVDIFKTLKSRIGFEKLKNNCKFAENWRNPGILSVLKSNNRENNVFMSFFVFFLQDRCPSIQTIVRAVISSRNSRVYSHSKLKKFLTATYCEQNIEFANEVFDGDVRFAFVFLWSNLKVIHKVIP